MGKKIKLTEDKFKRFIKTIEEDHPLDHHGEDYEGLEGLYDGMDANDYEFERGLSYMEEGMNNEADYSHFAVNKATNKIVNGWDYASYDPAELRQFKKDYFLNDLIDYELDPKQYRIVTGKYLLKQGIDPNDDANWANS